MTSGDESWKKGDSYLFDTPSHRGDEKVKYGVPAANMRESMTVVQYIDFLEGRIIALSDELCELRSKQKYTVEILAHDIEAEKRLEVLLERIRERSKKTPLVMKEST